jgi:hypothetical protein
LTSSLFTAWDVNERSPRLFTKWAFENNEKINVDDKQPHNLKFKEMILASGATPYYFSPAGISSANTLGKAVEHYYLSGDNIALSPAMYAYLHAHDVNKIDVTKIRMVSIGAINETPDKIGT